MSQHSKNLEKYMVSVANGFLNHQMTHTLLRLSFFYNMEIMLHLVLRSAMKLKRSAV